tara:strand:- start:120 stop:443 length:324 start_codon:yes stop_codon:yes gene_type:complete
MKLITKEIKAKLLANQGKDNCYPVLKLFNPVGSGTWLITEMHDDEDTLWGLCDLGFGFPELGTVSLKELESVQLQFGLGIERDLYWEPEHRIDTYYELWNKQGGSVQ